MEKGFQIYNRFSTTNCILFATMLATGSLAASSQAPLSYGIEPLNPKIEHTAHVSSNPNLYVSAENPMFKNYFAGPQVIEVIVSDPDINRLDQAYGEPIVTVNGKRLRMAQTTDGTWHAFFADAGQAQHADATQTSRSGKGLDFGQFCSGASSQATGVDFTETRGIAVARHFSGASNGTQPLGTCTASNIGGVTNIAGGTLLDHVVRQNQTLNSQAPGGRLGQIAEDNAVFSSAWPVIQLYDFAGFPQTVTVQYEKAGGVQSVDLVFDLIPAKFIHPVTIRPDYPQGAQVQADLVDPQLNIDPTEDDSWTWGTAIKNNTLYYQVFDRNGRPDADGTPGMQNVLGNLTTLMFNHNGRLTLDPRPQGVAVGESQSNEIQTLMRESSGLMRTMSISGASIPITLLEVQPNTGILADYDAGGIADIKILENAKRDTSINAKYNDVSYSVVVKYHDAKITMGFPSTPPPSASTPVRQLGHQEIESAFASLLGQHIVRSLLLY